MIQSVAAAAVLTDSVIADEIVAITDTQEEPIIIYPFHPPSADPPVHTHIHYLPPPRTSKHSSLKNKRGTDNIPYMLVIGTLIYGSIFLFDWFMRSAVRPSQL